MGCTQLTNRYQDSSLFGVFAVAGFSTKVPRLTRVPLAPAAVIKRAASKKLARREERDGELLELDLSDGWSTE